MTTQAIFRRRELTVAEEVVLISANLNTSMLLNFLTGKRIILLDARMQQPLTEGCRCLYCGVPGNIVLLPYVPRFLEVI